MTTTTRKAPPARKRKLTPEARAARTRTVMRAVALTGGLPVFAVALYVSYGHIRHVTLTGGESVATANIMALSVDGMLLVASVAMLAGYRTVSAYAAFVLGCLASLGANIFSAVEVGTPTAYVVAGWPAVAMIVTSEMLARMFLPAKAKRRKAPARRATATVRASRTVAQSQGNPVPATA